MPYQRELDAALEGARRVRTPILEVYQGFQPIPDARAEIHLDIDRQTQEALLQLLTPQFVGDGFIAEEETPTLALANQSARPERRRLWIIDPIDGTRGFARKTGEFSVMIGFVDSGQPVVGVVLEPANERLTYAVRGGGCWRVDTTAGQPQRCRVSTVNELASATLVQSHRKDPAVPTRHAALLQPARVVETYSAGIKLARVARGEVDLYVNNYEAFHDWDICAGHVLVEEAGGKVTGLAGDGLRYGSPGAWQRQFLLATNGVLHGAAVARLAPMVVGGGR
jgi:3'(2'), 5'-bisphosphate nucleotidase